jgi:WD40 repeat protein
MKKQMLVADYEPSYFELTYLLVNEERKKSFVADRNGSIFIFDTDDSKPKPLIHLASNLGFVRGLVVDSKKNYLLAVGHDEGEFIVYDIGKPGKEGYTKEVAKLKNKAKSREICWSSARGEAYVGNDDGTVTIWNAKKAEIICN